MKLTSLIAGLACAFVALAISAAPIEAHDTSAMTNGAAERPAGAMAQMGSHMSMGPHMVMTTRRSPTAEDLERGRYIVDTLRRSIIRYKNYKVALAQGYFIFLPSLPQEVYHFVSRPNTYQEYNGHFSLERPGSLLYLKKGAGDYRLVGAMYSAPPEDTPDDLNQLIPLSVGTWHAHTDICLPEGITIDDLVQGNFGADGDFMPGMIPASQSPRARALNREYGIFADGRFGFTGRIADPNQCKAAGGHFIKQAFGWMIHVYPFAGDDLEVAFSTDVPKGENAFAR